MKNCPFCNKIKELKELDITEQRWVYNNIQNALLYYNDGKLFLYGGIDGKEIMFEVNYCPVCGKMIKVCNEKQN